MSNEHDLNELSARINDLVQRIEFIGDPAVHANVVTLVQALMDLHQRGFSRMVDILQSGKHGAETLQAFASDDLVAGLLVLYGLHPDSVESRIRKAIAKVSGELALSGSRVELMSIDGGVLRIRLATASSGCSSSGPDIEKIVRDTVYSEAPDVDRVDIERVSTRRSGAEDLVQLQIGATSGSV